MLQMYYKPEEEKNYLFTRILGHYCSPHSTSCGEPGPQVLCSITTVQKKLFFLLNLLLKFYFYFVKGGVTPTLPLGAIGRFFKTFMELQLEQE